ncbi:sensor histidine kinase [Paenibacillus flagellatus]|nr:sensor histidine kinase [Paenibacillus flagellatus]
MPRRWLITYLLLIVLPSTILLYAYYKHSTTVLEEEVSDSMLQTMKQAGINLSYRFGYIRDIVNTVTMNRKLYEFLEEESNVSVAQQLEETKEIRDVVRNVQSNADVSRLRLFVKSTNMLASEHINFFSLDSLQNWPYYRKVLDANGGIVWTSIYQVSYIDRGEESILSVARMLHDSRQYNQVAAILVLDVPEKLVMDILSEIDLTKQKKVYIVDSDGKVMAHTDRSLIGIRLSDELAGVIARGTDGKEKLQLDKQDEYIVYSTIETTGWKVVAQVPASEISARVKLNQVAGIATLVGILMLFFVLVFALLAVIVRSMNRRIDKVIRAIRQEGIEWLDGNPAPEGDFMLLERSVDVLIHRVHSLMEQTYEAQVLEREAQLRALQAQINPHFLYNTLDTINWMAIGHNVHDISQMIDALAKYFRLSLNKGRDKMTVEDELTLAQVYLDIQKSRFLNSFDYRIETDPNVMTCIVPKLTLQPLVENALLHGIRKMKNKQGMIRITASRQEGFLILTVSDDGIGMEGERARLLLVEPVRELQTDGLGSSYGLNNVNERIKLFAGESSGLSICSSPGEGTTVTIRIKLNVQEHS